jgi:squalene-hopene/tetraprenyl-beta-curcumene cyclase
MGKGRSTASQTAWALMGLLAYLPREDAAIKRGVAWLVTHQNAAGSWDEAEFTGTGFPNHFYLRYNLYRHYFPLMALGRFTASTSP